MEEMIERMRKYNIWDGKELKCGMLRQTYIGKVAAVSGNRLVKVLTGQRRTGKSYILRQLMEQQRTAGTSPRNILFISMEHLDFDFIADYRDLEAAYEAFRTQVAGEGKKYIYLDEVQNIAGWEKFVNSHSQDFTDECEFFITGSNSRMLSTELATLLSGRYVEIPVYTYGYAEYLQATNETSGRETFRKYLTTGGLPELMNMMDEEARRFYTSAAKDTIVLRDILQRRQNIRDPKLLDDLFAFLICNASNPISIQNIVKYFKSRQRTVAYETIANYIAYIAETFLVHPVMQYDVKGKMVAENPFKYYANDLAFRNYLYAGAGYGIGYLLENAIFLELKRNGFEVYEGVSQKKEVDFVAIKKDRKIYIQVAYSIEDDETRQREYASLLSIGDSYEKWVVTMDDYRVPMMEGVQHVWGWEVGGKL